MSVAWGEITDAEIAEGVQPSAIMFSKLVNNPRAVFYGDLSVPYSKRILAEQCASPVAGVANNFLLSDGQGGLSIGLVSFPPLMVAVAAITSAVTASYSPFPVNGVYTIMLWGNGGAGATGATASGRHAPGGAGGFVKGYVNAKSTDQITVSGFVAGQPAFVYDVAGAWRADAGAGQIGTTSDAVNSPGGTASFTGFMKGYALPGAGNYMNSHGRAAAGPTIADYGRGGEYNGAGKLGAVFIARGVI